MPQRPAKWWLLGGIPWARLTRNEDPWVVPGRWNQVKSGDMKSFWGGPFLWSSGWLGSLAGMDATCTRVHVSPCIQAFNGKSREPVSGISPWRLKRRLTRAGVCNFMVFTPQEFRTKQPTERKALRQRGRHCTGPWTMPCSVTAEKTRENKWHQESCDLSVTEYFCPKLVSCSSHRICLRPMYGI